MSARSASDNGTNAVAEAGGGFGQAVMTDTGRILDTELPDELQKSYLSVSPAGCLISFASAPKISSCFIRLQPSLAP